MAREQTRRVLIAFLNFLLHQEVCRLAGDARGLVRSLIRIYQLGASGHRTAQCGGGGHPFSLYFSRPAGLGCAAAQSHELIKRTAAATAAAAAESGCTERAKSLACMSVSFQLSGPQNSTSLKQTLTMGL